MTTKVWGEEYRTTTVCVDSYQDGVLSGWFYSQYLPEGRPFKSAIQLLQEMERALDGMEFPKAFTVTRTFAPSPQPPPGRAETDRTAGGLATFAVRVLFRQNASWQGSITWLEGRREQSFRSVLELLLLMDNALSGSQAEIPA